MIVDRSQVRWIVRSSVAGAVTAVMYIVYAVTSRNGPRGGSPVGIAFGSAATALIVFECLLSLRKRYPASPLGPVSAWLRAHVWLGLLSFLWILFHSGFRWGQGLAAALMWMFAIVLASGIFGLALQNYLPRRMTELVPRETVYEQIPAVVGQLRASADERVEFITADLGLNEPAPAFVRAGGVKQYFDAAQKKSAAEKVEAVVAKRKASHQITVGEEAVEALRAHYLEEIRPYLFQRPGVFSRKLFATAAGVRAYFAHLRTIFPVAAHQVLLDLEEICEERRELLVQQRLHHWLHAWLFVHVPLSMALLPLSLVHAVVSLRY